ncbi:MAG TPA: Flp pilus assembly protein CpaB [Clostridiales bacterium]|jgi:pilus assembly protein CpaB|nr:Flp pilus assembly protein CpaB [Clostridiales bacterium]
MKKVKVLALVTAVIAAVLLYNYLNMLNERAAVVEVIKTGVLTASENIPPNTTITADMVELKELPVEAVHKEAMTNINAAVGKFSKYEITAGEQVLSTKLISPDGGGGDGTLAYEIAPGMRAISVDVGNLSGLVGMLRPKNTVDILLQYQEEKEDAAEGEEKEMEDFTAMIAENITILAVDDVLSQDGKPKNPETGVSYTTITLQVTPREAMDISMSEVKGNLRMILRSPLDKEMTGLPETKSIIFDDVVVK